ncbi:hypothetical protein ABZ619_28815 [Streptomyces sp. NPDC007851]|uniref:hypothetical protein n=1 Tax=Streptomyces sp. NPDC007851 TaxID=3155008 RepID=UPI0033C98B17
MATVSLTEASKEDAATVFGVLRTVFPTDRPADDLPEEQPGGHADVWSAEFEPTREWSAPAPVTLHGSVSATLQGDYLAVDRLSEVLSAVFAVQERGAASGDQEKEVDLRLGTKE